MKYVSLDAIDVKRQCVRERDDRYSFRAASVFRFLGKPLAQVLVRDDVRASAGERGIGTGVVAVDMGVDDKVNTTASE